MPCVPSCVLRYYTLPPQATTNCRECAAEVGQAFAEAARKVEKYAATLDFTKDGEAAVVAGPSPGPSL